VDSDAAQFRELYEIHFDAVARYAGARAGPDAAKDAVAQTFTHRRSEQLVSNLVSTPRKRPFPDPGRASDLRT
jgi:hypothetical protein